MIYIPDIMEQVRAFSKRLFGAWYRLEVAAALVSGEIVSLTDLHQSLPHAPSVSSVAKELQVLEGLGLLERQPAVPGMRTVYLRPIVSPYWETCRSLWALCHAGQDPSIRLGEVTRDGAGNGKRDG